MSQRTKAGSIDANEEYYGYGKSSPIEGGGDKDYRTRNGDSADKVESFCFYFVHLFFTEFCFFVSCYGSEEYRFSRVFLL